MLDTRYWMLDGMKRDAGYWILDAGWGGRGGYREMLDTGCWMLDGMKRDAGYQTSTSKK